MNKENKNLIYTGLVVVLSLSIIICFLLTSRKQNSLADTTTPIVLGDVNEADTLLINVAKKDLQKARQEAEQIQQQVQQNLANKEMILNNTINEVVTKSGVIKDWRQETISEKQDKPDTYTFVKRPNPIAMPTPSTKVEPKK